MNINKFVKSLSDSERTELFKLLSVYDFMEFVATDLYDDEIPLCRSLFNFFKGFNDGIENEHIIIDAMKLSSPTFIKRWIPTIGKKRKDLLLEWIEKYNNRHLKTKEA